MLNRAHFESLWRWLPTAETLSQTVAGCRCHALLVYVVVVALLAGCNGKDSSEATVGATAIGKSATALNQIGLESHPDDIHQLVSQLSPVDRDQLRKQRARFDALEKDEKERLREFHSRLSATEAGTDLYTVLRQYRDWLATIPDGERADLLEMPPEQRIGKIREIQLSQQASNFRRQAGNLSREDATKISSWLRDYVQTNGKSLLRQMSKATRDRFERTQEGRRRQRMLFLEVARNARSIQFPEADQEKFRSLHDSLSADGAARLSELVDTNDSAPAVRELVMMLADSVKESIHRRMPSKERMIEFYDNDLTTEQRDRIDQMPPEEAKRELMRYYFILKSKDRSPETGRRPPFAREGRGGRDERSKREENSHEDRGRRGRREGESDRDSPPRPSRRAAS